MANAETNTCSLLSGSSGLHCNSMQAFIARRLSAARVSGDMKNLDVGGSEAPCRLPSFSRDAIHPSLAGHRPPCRGRRDAGATFRKIDERR